MIAQKTIQEVYDTVRVEEVVQDFVSLKRAGANLKGLCPFHNEKTPSFVVSPAKNVYKCFGCGKGGNPVNFVMEHEHFSFPEAIRYLAARYNIEIEEKELSAEELESRQLTDSLFIVNEFAQQFYQNQLFDTDRGRSVGLSYLKKRGFREATIKQFGLGFAPDQRDALTKYALENGHKIEMLQQLGLSSAYDTDFFKNRVMFTIHNLSGKPVAFAGRILQQKAKAPKYINSPETEIYTKSKVLYGMYQARTAIRKQDECILVEGYTDVISLSQAGIENVVASSGTALTAGQLRLIKRFTPNLKILYDGDRAGIKAALRGLDLALEQDLNVKIALIPEGKDPDTYLEQVGAAAFQQFISEEARDFIRFKIELLLEETADDPIKKAGLVKDIVSSIARIPDSIKRSVYVQECVRLMDIEESAIIQELQKASKQLTRQSQLRRDARQSNLSEQIATKDSANTTVEKDPASIQKKQQQDKQTGDAYQEKDIVRILICGGDQVYDKASEQTIAEYVLANIEDVLDSFEQNFYLDIVKECLQLLVDEKPICPDHFINHSNKNIAKLAVDLLHDEYEYSPGWEERGIHLRSQKMPEMNFGKDGEQALMRFKLRKLIKMCDQNQERLRDLKSDSDPTQMTNLLKVQQRLLQMRDELTKQLNTVILR